MTDSRPSTAWTQERLRQLIGRQIDFHYQHAWKPDADSIWFGKWSRPYHHWVRTQVETLALLAVYLDGHDDPKILGDINTGLLSACRTHRTDGSLTFEHTTGPWGCGWQSAWWTYRMIRCVQRLRDRLPKDTIAAVRRVVECEADRFIGVRPPAGVKYDTKMEENSWDAPMLAWASFVFSDHPNAARWELEARRWSFNALTRFKDKFDHSLIDGLPAAKWYTGPTMHPDFTSENHGTFHPNYQACVVHHGVTAMAYVTHGQAVPETILHNVREVADTLAYFMAPDCTQLMVTGNDWATYHGMNSMVALHARFLGHQWYSLAQANLDKIEWLLDKSDNGHLFGRTLEKNIDQQTFFFHTGNMTTAAEVYDVLPLKPPASPTAPPTGTRKLEYVEVICQRDTKRLAGVAWRTLYGAPLLTVLPLADTSFAGWAPWTGIGRLRLRGKGWLRLNVITHNEHAQGDILHAAGTLEWHDNGRPVVRQVLTVRVTMNGPVEYSEELTALAPIDLDANHGWCISVANDLHNGHQRRVNDRVVKSNSPTDIPLGQQVTIDGTLRYTADAELRYVSPGERLAEDNRFQCTQFDRLIAPGRTGPVAAGEVIRRGTLRIDVMARRDSR